MVINFRSFMTALRIYCEFRLCSCLFSLMTKQNSLFNKTQEKIIHANSFYTKSINRRFIQKFLFGFLIVDSYDLNTY